MIPRLVKKMVPYSLKARLYKRFQQDISFAQEGEDKILERIFNYKHNGFYVDIGAYHPVKFSNTYKFYLNEWRGINIDAQPGSMRIFDKIRPKDKNIEAAISDKEEILTYYEFNIPTLNSFSKELSEERNKVNGYKIISERQIHTQKLSAILDKNIDKNQYIDFMSVDVEGFDLNVLKSNNWDKYRPQILLVEILDTEASQTPGKESIQQFLKNINYNVIAKTFNTYFFIDEQKRL